MNLLYNTAIRLYYLFIFIASFFNEKARLWIEGRKNTISLLQQKLNATDKTIWIHCASLGEFEQGRPLIENLKKDFPGYKILLTFFSPSGYEIRRNYPLADCVCYLPIDTPENVKTFLDAAQPTMAIFVKYEFWHNFINELSHRKIPLFLISAIFRKEQIFFKPYGGFYRKVLRKIEHLFVQDEHSKNLLTSIAITNVTVSGDTRFDRVFNTASTSDYLPAIENFCNGKPTLIAGSSWPEDEKLLAEVFQQQQDWKLIIAPHETNTSNIERLEKLMSFKSSCRFSQLHTGSLEKNHDVLIIDTIGHLSKIYRYGTIAYIGGGFGKGIHNILEAAAFGLPVIFGPNYNKFREAKELIKAGGGFTIKDLDDLKVVFEKLKSNEQKAAAETAKNYVLLNIGATEKIISHITPLL
jgi:3-deoxy-D-manno-octulosonic-acid transferase